jgi:hypothetical protein
VHGVEEDEVQLLEEVFWVDVVELTQAGLA